MQNGMMALLEMLLVFGVVLGIAFYQLRAVRKRQAELRSEQQRRPDSAEPD